jgi:TonB-linked SusC/RagA family outer membrane protein
MRKKETFSWLTRACMTLLLAFFAISIYAQNVTVKGSVKDQLGDPVIGATVKVLGSSTGTVTDIDGNFSISCSPNATLEFSYIGFSTKAVDVKGHTKLEVTMNESTSSLDEVVVTALGIKKDAKKLGYSVSTVGSEELVKTGSPTFASAMYGKAAGVRIQTAPGGGTSSVSINVRGMSSITGTTQPLIVMDGVPIRNGDANNTDYWNSARINSNGLVDINPEDIESISILKGAAASALYGSEAANGVVVITSKTGKSTNGAGVEFNANLSWDNVAYMPEQQTEYGPGTYGMRSNLTDYMKSTGGFFEQVVNGKTYTHSIQNTYNYWGPKYDGSDVTYWDGTTRKYSSMGSNPWKDIFRTGFNQQYNIAITKGGEWGNIRIAYTYNNNREMQYNSHNSKHNFNITGTLNVLKNVKLDYSVQYMRQNIYNRAYRIARLTTNYNGMAGSFDDIKTMREKTINSAGFLYRLQEDKTSEVPEEMLLFSPGAPSLMSEYFWNIMGKVQEENNSRLIGGITPSWEIVPGLTLRGRIATDITSEDIENRENAERSLALATGSGQKGGYRLTNRKYETYYGDVMLMFDKTFADKHNITANVGWSGRRERTYAAIVKSSGGLSTTNWFNLANSILTTDNGDMEDIQTLRTAFFATASYAYDNWAYLEGTVRNEKISTLAPGNNSFTYPSINASAIITELLKDKRPTWWNYGKVRASYGIVGNAPTVYYANLLYTQAAYGKYLTNSIGSDLGNLNIKPEKKREFELGLEGKFLNNRLGFEFSFYNNDVKDQILQSTIARTAGGSSILLNIGNLTNKGAEFSIYGTPILTKDWQLDLSANIAFNKNKVTKLLDGVDRIQHLALDNSAYLYSNVGEPMGDWYVYKYKRDDQGRKIIGSDGLPIRDTELTKAGNAMPKGVGGFSASLRYKDFTLGATLDFRIGGDVINQYWQYAMETGHLKETLNGRDDSHGGLAYYYDNNNITATGKTIAGTAPAGYTQFNDGVIVEGVHEDGTPNTTIVPAGVYYGSCYGWGANAHNSYEEAIQDNSYLKFRELSLGYSLPRNITKAFGCQSLTLSVYGRNLFYIFKNLKEMDAESGDGTNWIYQSIAGGSSAASRTFGFSIRAKF